METIKQKIDRLEKELQEIKALQLASEVVEEPKFKEGDWCYSKNNWSEAILKFKAILGEKVVTSEYYQLNLSDSELVSERSSNFYTKSDNIRLATEDEIKRILTKVAQIKYPIGTRFKSVADENINTIRSNNFDEWVNMLFPKETNTIVCNNTSGIVYSSGKWAEIIVKEDLKVNGYEVTKVNKEDVKVGCKTFLKEDLETLRSFLVVYSGKYKYDGIDWTPEQIEKVLTVFD